MKTRTLCLTLFALLIANSLCLASDGHALLDPAIPDGERITYSLTSEMGNDTIFESTTIKGDDTYEIASKCGYENRTANLDKNSMNTIWVETSKHGRDSVVDMVTVPNGRNVRYGDAEIRIADLSALRYQLRGYPFGKLSQIALKTLTSQDEFSMKVSFAGEEKIETMGKSVDCYKLQFGIAGFLGMFLPKTCLWYSKESPHYLVRYEGSSDQRRLKKCRIEMIAYETRSNISTTPSMMSAIR